MIRSSDVVCIELVTECLTWCLGVYSERSVGPSYVVTQRLYVHRTLKSLIVVEVDLERSDVSERLELMLQLNRWVVSYDLTFVTLDSAREEVRFDIRLSCSLELLWNFLPPHIL